MTVAELEELIRQYTAYLFSMVQDHCWNKLSGNCVNFLSEISEADSLRPVKMQKQTKDGRPLRPIRQIAEDMLAIYDKLYDINLCVHRAEDHRTIIDIRYYPKSSLAKDYRELVRDNPPMWHAKVPLPPGLGQSQQKFDINWDWA